MKELGLLHINNQSKYLMLYLKLMLAIIILLYNIIIISLFGYLFKIRQRFKNINNVSCKNHTSEKWNLLFDVCSLDIFHYSLANEVGYNIFNYSRSNRRLVVEACEISMIKFISSFINYRYRSLIPRYRYIYVIHTTRALQSHDLSRDGINSGSHTYVFDHTRTWRASPDERSTQWQHEHERRYTTSTHPFILTRWIWKDDYDGQMIFGGTLWA